MGSVRGWPIGRRDRVLENLQYTSSSQNQRHSRNQRHDQRPSESDSSAFRAGAGQAQHGREPRLFEELDQLLAASGSPRSAASFSQWRQAGA